MTRRNAQRRSGKKGPNPFFTQHSCCIVWLAIVALTTKGGGGGGGIEVGDWEFESLSRQASFFAKSKKSSFSKVLTRLKWEPKKKSSFSEERCSSGLLCQLWWWRSGCTVHIGFWSFETLQGNGKRRQPVCKKSYIPLRENWEWFPRLSFFIREKLTPG